MKIETNDDVIFLKEVYNTIILKTNEGKCLYLCMRDGGFEMSVDNKNWHIIHSDDDFVKPSSANPRNLKVDNGIPQSIKQIPTAEEFLDLQHKTVPSTKFDIRQVMIEFAKLHVEVALRATSLEAHTKDVPYTDDVEVDENSILNSYPLKNIK